MNVKVPKKVQKYFSLFGLLLFFSPRKKGIVTANLTFVEIPVTLVKLVIMLSKTRIILAAEAK